MKKKKIVLADADIFIHLTKLSLFDLLEKLSKAYNWEILITPSVEGECKDPISKSLITSLLKRKIIKIHLETSKEVVINSEKLEKRMEMGAEIELFAIALFRKYNIITHDKENTDIFHKNFGRNYFYVYNLYHLFYLAYKAGIMKVENIEIILLKYLEHIGNRNSRFYKLIKGHGLAYYFKKLNDNKSKLIDPDDIEIFKN